jgi:hypothetical protein
MQAIARELRTAIESFVWISDDYRVHIQDEGKNNLVSLYREAHRLFQKCVGCDNFIPLPTDDDALIKTYKFLNFVQIDWDRGPVETIEANFMKHAFDAGHIPGFLDGRKVAMISTVRKTACRVAVVPAATCLGDVVYAIPYNAEKIDFLVLRPINSHADGSRTPQGEEIKQDTVSSDRIEKAQHFTLVGRGWVDIETLLDLDKSDELDERLEDVILY